MKTNVEILRVLFHEVKKYLNGFPKLCLRNNYLKNKLTILKRGKK